MGQQLSTIFFGKLGKFSKIGYRLKVSLANFLVFRRPVLHAQNMKKNMPGERPRYRAREQGQVRSGPVRNYCRG